MSTIKRSPHRPTDWVKTHDNVSIGANASNNGAWLSCDGYDRISVQVNMPSATTFQFWVDWSFDGSTYVNGTPSSNITGVNGGAVYDVQAPFYRMNVKNTDSTNAKTTNAYAYLKG